MSILKGKASFSQFKIDGGAAMLDAAEYYQKIKADAFRDLGLESKDENIGWTSIDNARDGKFLGDLTDGSQYRLFAMRIDRRTIPAAIVRMRCLEEEEKKLAETGQERLYREQRTAIRESVMIGLEHAIPPIPHIYEIIWDVEEGIVYFGSLSIPAIDTFVGFFMKTFNLILRPSSDISNNIGDQYMRREFLTWLWFKAEERDGVIYPSGLDPIAVFFVRRIALVAGEGEYLEQVVCQGEHADLKEGMEALRQGKMVIEARIRANREGEEFEFTTRANGYQYQGMKTPPSQGDEPEDKTGMALKRIHLIRQATGTMECLYRQYMKMRKSDEWPAEKDRMSQWVERTAE